VLIAVVADFYQTGFGVEKAGAEQVIQRSLKAIISAVSDAGIAMATHMTAARAFGLGIVPIGGIRCDPQAMIDLLGFLAARGLRIGYPDEKIREAQLSESRPCDAVNVLQTRYVLQYVGSRGGICLQGLRVQPGSCNLLKYLMLGL